MRKALLTITAAAAMAAPSGAFARVPWCGIFMMKLTGRHDPRLARAIEWRREGYDAGGPCVGCVVVWPHHVGKLVGYENGQWIVHSGNDGNRVRTRPRSLRGAVAFRRL